MNSKKNLFIPVPTFHFFLFIIFVTILLSPQVAVADKVMDYGGTPVYIASPFQSNVSFSSYSDGDDQVCYVVADDVNVGGTDDEGRQDTIFRINPYTGEEHLIGITGTLEIESIDFDPATGILYGTDHDQLGTIDLSTGQFTAHSNKLGSGDGSLGHLAFDDIDGMAFEPSTGILYATVRRSGKADLLIQINTHSGSAVADAFGPGIDYVVVEKTLNLPDIDDLAFDSNDGKLYGTANIEGYSDHLVQIDKTTGATHDVGRIQRHNGSYLRNFEAFTSNTSGELIGIQGGSTKTVYHISKGDAKASVLSMLSQASDYEAISCNIGSSDDMADLELEKSVDEPNPSRGDNVTFTVTVVNRGPVTAHSVEVTDVLPHVLPYASHQTGQGSYDPSTGVWDVGRLAVSHSATLYLTVTVNTGNPVTNTAEVTHADEPDRDSTPDNNDPWEDDQDDATVTPRVQNINLCIEKWVDNPAPNEGDEVVFSIRVCNDPADFTDIVVIDQLPVGLSFLGAIPERGWFSYDVYTRRITWEIPRLNIGEAATLQVRAKVQTSHHVENCAEIVQSTPAENTSDNRACASITPGGSSGGGDAGVESDGNLATELVQRLFHRRQDAQERHALRAAPEPVMLSNNKSAAFAENTPAGKTSINLAHYIPETGPQNTSAYLVTPMDLLGITNATSVFAADYLRPEGRRLAALFGATSPAGLLYDHAKATCDRLGGGRLEDVSHLNVLDHPFVLSRLIHANGNTDYNISFAAYRTAAGYTIDSRFAQSQYDVPVNASEVINLQVWSVAPQYTASLVEDILVSLSQEADLIFENRQDRLPPVPGVFVRDGDYDQGRLTLRIVNRSGASRVVVRGTAARTEHDAVQKIRMPFEHTVLLPEPEEGASYVEVEVVVGSVFDATFEVEDPETHSMDQLYYADGAWSYTWGSESSVTSFETSVQQEPAASEARYALERSALISGIVKDWASLFRYLRPNGQPVDLSDYEYIEFTAAGTGLVQVVVEKASIESWDQYGYTFMLSNEENVYRIPLANFSRSGGAGSLTSEDITLVAFYLVGNGFSSSPFELTVKNLSFVGSTTVANEQEHELPGKISLSQNFPNPFNPTTQIEFALSESVPVRISVFDVLGREVALLVDDVLGAGHHSASFDARQMSSGTYLYRLTTPSQSLVRKMVLMK